MKLDADNYFARLQSVQWFCKCGQPWQDFNVNSVQLLKNKEEAISSIQAKSWAWVRDEALNDLTGYLAKHHYNSYGGHWNKMVLEARSRAQRELNANITDGLQQAGFDSSIVSFILYDITMAALEFTYRRNFPKAPFFLVNCFRFTRHNIYLVAGPVI